MRRTDASTEKLQIHAEKSEDGRIAIVFHGLDIQQRALRQVYRAAPEFAELENRPDFEKKDKMLVASFDKAEHGVTFLKTLERALDNPANAKFIRATDDCIPFGLDGVMTASVQARDIGQALAKGR